MSGRAVRHQKHTTARTSSQQTRAASQTSVSWGKHLLHSQRLCSDQVAIFGPMTVPPSHGKWTPTRDVDGSVRTFVAPKRQCQTPSGSLTLIQAAVWAPTVGENNACLMEQQDWDDASPNRWPGLDASKINDDHQISPTQPMPVRVKAHRPPSGRHLPQ